MRRAIERILRSHIEEYWGDDGLNQVIRASSIPGIVEEINELIKEQNDSKEVYQS